jgi:hypothetical protein
MLPFKRPVRRTDTVAHGAADGEEHEVCQANSSISGS